MARAGLLTHRKFLRLVRLLEANFQPCPQALAAGLLELLWDGAYTAADDWVGTAEDVDLRVCWRGPAGTIAPALADAGFLDFDAVEQGYSIHDLWDHAPSHVQQRADRERARRARGKTLSELRSEAGKKGRRQRSLHERSCKTPSKDPATPRQQDIDFETPPADEPAPKGNGKLPFRAAEALELIASTAASRFLSTNPGRQAIEIERAIRDHPDPEDWRDLGRHFAAGGEAYIKGQIDSRWITRRNVDAALAHYRSSDGGEPSPYGDDE